MKTVTETEFTAHSGEWLKAAVQGLEEVVITQNGKPLARLSPCAGEDEPPSLFGSNKGRTKILGDIVNPIPGVWDADE